VKKPAEKRRRTKVQVKRLISWGVPEAKLKGLNPKQIRLMLKEPKPKKTTKA